ncbi:MAG: LamG-like jellyroll fold domain-containing protein [bacterium]
MENKRSRLYPQRRLGSLFLYALTSLCLLSAAAWALTTLSVKIIDDRQAKLVAELRGNVADSPASLVERLRDLQLRNIFLFVPGMKIPVSFSVGLFSFDPKIFPESFLSGLVFEVEHGSPVYHLKLREMRATREIEVLNADGKVFYVFKPSSDYDPRWLARQKRPQIYAASFPAEQRATDEEGLDPSHVEMEVTLIPDDYVEVYAEGRIASLMDVLLADSASRSLSGGMAMMRMAGSDTNIVVAQIGMVSSGMLLQVDYPDTLTNRFEMMISSNLMPRQWWVADTNLVTAGTNSLQWVDTGSTNGAGISLRFYSVGNSEDTDGDGIPGGREAIIYRTNPDALDSDGDGLVDGYSGVVSTNAYPSGVTTNGSTMVLGELSLGTDPTLWDTDGDGMSDGWEVAHGHNPLDPNDPPNVSGTLIYSGRQTGTVWVIAVTDSNSWSTGHSYTSAISGFPLTYFIPDLEQTNYWLKAWVDSIGNGQTNATEARGVFTNVLTVITNRVTGKGFLLADPDADGDNLPDWWEIAYFGTGTNTAVGDPDSDEYTNKEEYDADTIPTDISSHPWNLSGTITYTGPQAGIIHVVACTNGTDWAWVYADTLTNSMTYTITHLPPNTYYWMRAWRDSNNDNLPTSWEAWGSHNSNPVFLDDNLTGQDITLADPDADGDGLADWWEVLYGLDPTRGGGSGLSAWWKLDEGTGTNAFDSTANTNNGILYGFATNAWVTGIISNNLHFDGTNTYIEVPDSASLKSDGISIGLWVKPDRLYTNGTATFVSKRVPGGTTGYGLGCENGALAFTICKSGAKTLRYSCALTANVPVHVVSTYSSGNQQIYVNGVPVAQTNYIFGLEIGGIENGTNSLKLGAASGGILTNLFAGTLDDVRIGPGAWPSNDVVAIYQLGADLDHDGLSTSEEYKHGANPTNSDTDGDGLSDYAEVFTYGTDPAKRDTDDDGMDDDEELLAGTNPTVPNGGASTTSIRYYYDTDDRLTGAYGGADGGGGSGIYTITPAGNISSTAERRTP